MWEFRHIDFNYNFVQDSPQGATFNLIIDYCQKCQEAAGKQQPKSRDTERGPWQAEHEVLSPLKHYCESLKLSAAHRNISEY